MANTHEHLEHAEHAPHHAADPFNQRVAVSMAIIAAVLAGLSMYGHRLHNKVLQLQGDSNRYKTEAATATVESSNAYAFFQSKRLRQSQFQVSAELAVLSNPNLKDEAAAAVKGAKEKWAKKAAEPKDAQEPKKEPTAREKDGKRKREELPTLASWADKVEEYNYLGEKESLPNLIKKGKEYEKKSEELLKKAAKAKDDAEHAHHQADKFDIAHLLAEIGLVVCSVALLTKKKLFWLIGILATAMAIGAAVWGFTLPHHPHDDTAHTEKH